MTKLNGIRNDIEDRKQKSEETRQTAITKKIKQIGIDGRKSEEKKKERRKKRRGRTKNTWKTNCDIGLQKIRELEEELDV